MVSIKTFAPDVIEKPTEAYQVSVQPKKVEKQWRISVPKYLIYSFVVFMIGYLSFNLFRDIRCRLELLSHEMETSQAEILRLEEKARTTEQELKLFKKIYFNKFRDDNKEISSRFKRQLQAGFVGAHLTGVADGSATRSGSFQEKLRGEFFSWDAYDLGGIAFSTMQLDSADNPSFVEINTNGYYQVYSQIAYFGRGQRDTGHQTVLINQSEKSEEDIVVLLETINSQRRASSHKPSIDSDFHSGVFRLYSGDKIGVRPVSSSKQEFMMLPSRSFFGVVLLNEF